MIFGLWEATCLFWPPSIIFSFFLFFWRGGGGAQEVVGAIAVHSILRGMNKLYENIIVISEENKTFRSLNATKVGTFNDAGTF